MSHAQQPPAIRVRRTAQPRPATQATARPVQAAMQSHHGRSSNPLLVVAGIILAVFGAVAMMDGLLMIVDSVAEMWPRRRKAIKPLPR
jgi:hypothetical protein